MAAVGAVDAVTFDFWNTMVAVSDGALYERRLELWRGHLDDHGHVVDDARLRIAFGAAFERFNAAWERNQQFRTDDAVTAVLDHLEVEADDELRAALTDAFRRASHQAGLEHAEGIDEVLVALRAAGVRIGIICDVGMSTPSSVLREVLDGFGLLDHFDHWSFSDEVGVYKPDPAIFDHARSGLGSEPGRTAHVGDLRRTDVDGARGAGWVSVRYRGLFDDGADEEPSAPVEADHVIGHHVELLDVLGLG